MRKRLGDSIKYDTRLTHVIRLHFPPLYKESLVFETLYKNGLLFDHPGTTFRHRLDLELTFKDRYTGTHYE